ncbi:hypothetical protein F0P96_05225 [Hymenobacter busanensis]|uniref:Uncharacterized protein n=1 Tax=Hymenobacter busanensis TaxID=2607656 RepID=A0AA88K011_9BACT|nr:hypothetical protein [Hymenobacter busanensis]KAA9338247.1 hypothetical protein F0P96_05225 [Hymenobacter busanensis]
MAVIRPARPLPSLEALLIELEDQLPQYSYRLRRYVHGTCILAWRSTRPGAEIWVKAGGLLVEEAVPDNWTAALSGRFGLLGLLVMRLFNRRVGEARRVIARYLALRYGA